MLCFVETARMRAFIENFAKFETRWHDSPSGLFSQKWLLDEIHETIAKFVYIGEVEVSLFHHQTPQSSIVVRVGGKDDAVRNQVVILGAHQDSMNQNGFHLAAPGMITINSTFYNERVKFL